MAMAPDAPAFGVLLPAWSDAARPDGIRRVARAAETAGFDAIWRGDHVVFPEEIPEGGPFAEIDAVAHDVFQVLAHVAAITDELRVGTNVCVVPYRHPVSLAKQALTLDALAEGRFEFGVGVGVHRSEFDVLDVPYAERGSRTDEFLALFDRVREEGEVAFDGPHHAFGRTGFYPRPAREGGPPVWVGGESSAALRRVAKHGVGWTTFGHPPSEVREMRGRLSAAWEDHGREGDPELAVPVDVAPDRAPDPEAGYVTGTAETDRRVLERYVEAGATRVNVACRGLAIDRRIDLIESLGETVAAVGGQ